MEGKRDKSEFAVRIGRKLRELRGSRSFSDVSEATGGAVSARLVQYYEQGTEPRFGSLLALLSALGATPNEFAPELMRASAARNAAEVCRIVFGTAKAAPRSKRPKIEDDATDPSELASSLGIL